MQGSFCFCLRAVFFFCVIFPPVCDAFCGCLQESVEFQLKRGRGQGRREKEVGRAAFRGEADEDNCLPLALASDAVSAFAPGSISSSASVVCLCFCPCLCLSFSLPLCPSLYLSLTLPLSLSLYQPYSQSRPPSFVFQLIVDSKQELRMLSHQELK